MYKLKPGGSIGPYVLVHHIPSKGGMAFVYQAREKDTKANVAVKISKPGKHDLANKNAIRLEAEVLQKFSHPNVVKLLPINLPNIKNHVFTAKALSIEGEPWYYAMEYLAGGSLGEILKQHGRLPLSIASAIVAKIASGLEHIHSKKIYHLDLKPENILFRQNPAKNALINPVIIDFGVAARYQKAALGGSHEYMSQEHLRRANGELPPETPLDYSKMDIYSLGVVMYKSLTGRPPFDARDRKNLTSQIIRGAIMPPSEHVPNLPHSIDRFIEKWLAKDPLVRPSVSEIKANLKVWSKGLKNFPESFAIQPMQKRVWKLF